jgi:hypothetical protein
VADNRRDELLGAALADELTPQEREELDALLRDDPTARAELEGAAEAAHALDVVRLGSHGRFSWTDAEPPAGLRDRVLAAAATQLSGRSTAERPTPVPGPVVPLSRRTGTTSGRRRRVHRLLAAAAAVVLLVAGVGGGLGLAAWLDRPAQGPAGTLGALEPVSFTGVPAGVDVTASVVAHTWGTETVFTEISGLPVGSTYEVVLVAGNGAEVATGSFEAVAGPVNCRMTNATMRPDVRAISVRADDGTEVMRSALPEVEGD